MNLSERTKLAIELAKLAGKEVKRIRDEEDIQTKEKGFNDVVTVADVRSESIITARINEMFPNDKIISEEAGECKSGDNEYSWAIDPVDGTLNYSRGMSLYCVSIGYMKDNKPYGGAVYIPELDELYFGEKGKGAYCNGKRISVSKVTDISKALTLMDFTNREPFLSDSFNNAYCDCMNKMVNVEKIFSGAISLCYIASGKVDAYIGGYGYIWDICAGSLLIEEAGGKFTGVNKKEINYAQIDKQLFIATNGNIHDDFEKIINKSF